MEDKKSMIKTVGDQVFREKGFKATNVAEIMKRAKMAVGTFYNYYSSKDELFMEIYIEENEILKRSIMTKIDINGHPMAVMGQMMMMNEQGMMENPILKEWYNRESFNKIEKAFIEQKGLENVDFMYASFIEVVKHWQATGVMRQDLKPEMIMAIFTALVQVESHKEDIGIQYFPDLMHHMATFVMTGLLNASH